MSKGTDWELLDARLIELFEKGVAFLAIGMELGVSQTAVGRRVVKLRLSRTRYKREAAPRRALYQSRKVSSDDPGLKIADDRNGIVAQDEAFQTAMKCAIYMGLERAPIGIVKDDTPFFPKTYQRQHSASGCSSPAGWLAELGGAGGTWF